MYIIYIYIKIYIYINIYNSISYIIDKYVCAQVVRIRFLQENPGVNWRYVNQLKSAAVYEMWSACKSQDDWENAVFKWCHPNCVFNFRSSIDFRSSFCLQSTGAEVNLDWFSCVHVSATRITENCNENSSFFCNQSIWAPLICQFRVNRWNPGHMVNNFFWQS